MLYLEWQAKPLGKQGPAAAAAASQYHLPSMSHCSGCTVRLGEDNTAALAAVTNLSAKSPA